MSRAWCARETDVLRAVGRGWGGGAEAGLVEHVPSCARCTEVLAAAEVLRAQYVRDMVAARVPLPAVMWWRIERRLREEHARRLQRIALATQAVVLAAAAGGAVGVLQMIAVWLPGSSSVASVIRDGAVWLAGNWAQAPTSMWTLPVAIVAAAWLVLVPAALYLGFAEE